MIVSLEQSSVKVANELFVTRQKYGRLLRSKDSDSKKKGRMKNQDPIGNNVWAINVPNLSKSRVPDELIILEETQVLEEIATSEKI